MKVDKKLLLGMLLGIFCTACIAYLSPPHSRHQFKYNPIIWTSLLYLTLAFLLFLTWNSRAGSTDDSVEPNSTRNPADSNTLLRIAITVLVVLGGWWSGMILLNQSSLRKQQLQHHAEQISQQAELLSAIRISSLAHEMSEVLNRMTEELAKQPGRMLSEETINRAAALSYALHPSGSIEHDSLYPPMWSQERGHLLLAICGMQMDTGSMHKLMARASFSGANLPGAHLQNADLTGADLSGANLRDALLTGAILERANLSFAVLWGSKLNRAKLNHANLQRVDLRWAEMNEAELIDADLHEADLTSAQLRKSNLQGADLKWANCRSALLDEADLTGADMFRADLKKAQLVKANLSGANLTLAIVSEAILSNTNLSQANLDGIYIPNLNWLDQLDSWVVQGRQDILAHYRIVDGTSYDSSKFQLKKIVE